jgi:hypothetical protein
VCQSGELKLPESPQHRDWREARSVASGQISSFRDELRTALADTADLLVIEPPTDFDDELVAQEWERRRGEERTEAGKEVADADARRHRDAGGLRSDEGSGLLDGQADQDGKQEESQR